MIQALRLRLCQRQVLRLSLRSRAVRTRLQIAATLQAPAVRHQQSLPLLRQQAQQRLRHRRQPIRSRHPDHRSKQESPSSNTSAQRLSPEGGFFVFLPRTGAVFLALLAQNGLADSSNPEFEKFWGSGIIQRRSVIH